MARKGDTHALPSVRFWRQVVKLDGDDACWLFTGRPRRKGARYCRFRTGGKGSKEVPAHVYAWEEENGPVPAGKILLHRCDNPPCVRPKHLRPGTNKENTQDAKVKGRLAKHERHGRTHLVQADVDAIRASTEPQRVIARRYSVSQASVCRIRAWKVWV